jgi:hypothetical protein
LNKGKDETIRAIRENDWIDVTGGPVVSWESTHAKGFARFNFLKSLVAIQFAW